MKKYFPAIKNNKSDLTVLIYVFASVFLRYLCYGFTYFYQLDDYIQFWAYPNRPDPWEVVAEQGLLCSRPLAGLGDIFFWSGFFDFMIVAVLILSLLYALSAVLFLKVFKKHFHTGFMFVMFYAIAPFFFEGAYWVSASTRVVVGLFFTSLAVFGMQKMFDTKKRLYMAVFWIAHLLSLCFYEQVFIVSMALCFFIIILNSIESKKNFKWIIPVILNAIIYFAFTSYFKNAGTTLSNRLEIVIPSLSPWYIGVVKDLLVQIKNAFVTAPVAITVKGFVRGIKIILKDGLWLAFPIAVALGYATFRICRKDHIYSRKTNHKIRTIIIAIILAVAPLSVFFIIANPYVSLRNILPSFVGIAIILDMIFALLAKRIKLPMQILASFLAAVFFIASVSEIHDYKAVYEFDNRVTKKIESVIKENGYAYSAFIIQGEDKGEFNIKFHEHGYGVSSSGWATCGLLNYYDYDNKKNNAKAEPIETENGIYHRAWDKELKDLTSFDKLYLWNNEESEFTEVFADIKDECTIVLITESGEELAYTNETKDNIGYITFN